MQRSPIGPLHDEYGRHLEPRLRIAPGDSVIVETEDALSGQIRSDGDRREKEAIPFSNPLTGPLRVESSITLNLVERSRLASPRLESPDEIMTVATGLPMERSIASICGQLSL